MPEQAARAELLSFTLTGFQRSVDLLLLVWLVGTTLPSWLSSASSWPVPFSVMAHTHCGYWRTGSTSVYALGLGAVDVGICNKGCLSLSCMSPCPPAVVFTSAKESCEAEMAERLCDGVLPAVCACLSGEGSGSLVWHTWLHWLIGDYFWHPMAPFLKLKFYAVFLPSNFILQSLYHSSDIKYFSILLSAKHDIPMRYLSHNIGLRVQHTTHRAPLSSCQLKPWVSFKK